MPIHNVQYPTKPPHTPQNLLTVFGPIISSSVSIPAKIAQIFSQEKKSIPTPVSGPALLDTGASATCVDEDILKSLGMPPVGQVRVSTPSGTVVQLQYPVRLEFPGSLIPILELNAVIGSSLKDQKIAVLIGRDILCRCLFIMNGPSGHFSLSF